MESAFNSIPSPRARWTDQFLPLRYACIQPPVFAYTSKGPDEALVATTSLGNKLLLQTYAGSFNESCLPANAGPVCIGGFCSLCLDDNEWIQQVSWLER